MKNQKILSLIWAKEFLLRSYLMLRLLKNEHTAKNQNTNIKQMERNKFNTINFYRILKCARDSCKALLMTHNHSRTKVKQQNMRQAQSCAQKGSMKKVGKLKINESATQTQQLVLIRLDLAYSVRHIFSSTSPFSYFRAFWSFLEKLHVTVCVCAGVFFFVRIVNRRVASHRWALQKSDLMHTCNRAATTERLLFEILVSTYILHTYLHTYMRVMKCRKNLFFPISCTTPFH